MTDLLIVGGELVDGTGAPRSVADVAISGEKITAVGNLEGAQASRVIDARNKIVCPGFIDIHTHSDLTLLSSPLAQSKVRQGVTTEVVGNCGLGVAPIPSGVDVASLRAAVSYLDVDPEVAWTWSDQAGYLATMERAKPSVNVAALVAHIPLHSAVAGFDDRVVSVDELSRMKDLLAESLDAGAYGLSTGLGYAPVCYSSDEELAELARIVASRDKLFAWHLRDYSDNLLSSVSQAVTIAEVTGCRTQISHLVSVGRRNWGAVREALDVIDAANQRGADIAADVYPYTAGNCPMSQLLPNWAQAGGDAALRERLADRRERLKVIEGWDNRSVPWSEIFVSLAPGHNADIIGRSVEESASALGVTGDEFALDLLAEMGNAVGIVAHGRSEDDVVAVLRHATTLVGSDGQALDRDGATGRGAPHPRSFGCYPRLLAKYAGVSLPLERAVYIATGAVARRLDIKDRGRIEPDLHADLVVFDPTSVCDLATFDDPQCYPVGIDTVIVNGSIVVDNGEHTGAAPGKVLLAH